MPAKRHPHILEAKDVTITCEKLAMGVVALSEEALEIAVRNTKGRKSHRAAAARLEHIGASIADLARAMTLIAGAQRD